VRRICLIQHTGCAMVGLTEDEMRAKVGRASGEDASGWTFLTTADQEATMRSDIERIRACPLIDDLVEIAGFVFDVHTGELTPIDA
jgi:carbonic anhydrase